MSFVKFSKGKIMDPPKPPPIPEDAKVKSKKDEKQVSKEDIQDKK